jgi:hypothetical protein
MLQEPWTAGHETMVAEGPKGLRIGGIICYDGGMRATLHALPLLCLNQYDAPGVHD